MEKAAQWPSPSSLLRGCVLKVSKPPWKTHIVPDIDVRAFGQQQLHQVHMLVLSGPDHRRPTTIILSIRDKRYHQTANRRKTSCSLLREFAQGTVFWQVKGGTWLPPKAQFLHNRGGRLLADLSVPANTVVRIEHSVSLNQPREDPEQGLWEAWIQCFTQALGPPFWPNSRWTDEYQAQREMPLPLSKARVRKTNHSYKVH